MMNVAAKALAQTGLERHTLLAGLVSRRHLSVVLLAILVFITSFAVIYVKDYQRRLYAETQSLIAQNNQIETDWGKLLLEQSTWTMQSRIERIAATQLNMVTLNPKDIIMVQVDSSNSR
jgi:cell division protein FtsL